ncbi:MAG TPA: DUF2330 domain-containing protein [Polyangiaceae bacterium]|nr:DUF2330 domain-containing protein [Polyangiaceae bacterium]
MRLHVLLGALGLGVLSIAALAKPAQACGGCFQPPSQSGDVITDEKMIFRVSPQSTTLYDEIEYSGNPASFGWVLPIHGQVTVGLSSDLLFQSLEAATATTIQAPYIPPCSCGCGGQTYGAPTANGAAGGGSSSGGGVNVISQQTVGPYDTVQLQSTDPNALNNWLAANGYVVPSGFQPVIAAYVKEGFDFLALKLAPGQGVAAMRPVRVTTPGAGLSLPLRMVAAGTGATVGVTVWVMADGRYEPANMKSFTIDPSEITWDFSTSTSNYAQIRQQKEQQLNFAAWQIESSIQISPYQVEGPVMSQSAEDNYPVDGDAGAGGSQQAQQADLTTMFPDGESTDVWVTRMRSDLSHAALATDLFVQASSDQTQMSNVYQVTKSVNAPSCQATYCGCNPEPGPVAGGGGWLFGAPTGTGGSTNNSGCAAAPEAREEGRSTWLDLALVGVVVGGSIVGKRVRRRRSS